MYPDMVLQKTIRQPVSIIGIGLHSGLEARVVLRPSRPNSGIVFVRADLPGAPEIPASFKYVVNTQMATTLGKGQATISTVEHLMAAIAGMDIDNLRIEVFGPEMPILDGSSIQFVEAIQNVGVETQLQARPVLVLRKKVEIKVAEKWAVAEPSSRLEIHGSIDWDHPAIGFQEFSYVEGMNSFEHIASARTFGFLRDVEMLKKRGLARGGSIENAVVLDDTSVLNPEGLRYPDEMARHKVLDALGDFKLSGVSICASIRLHRAGHDLHSQLLQAIFKDPANYQILDGSADIQKSEFVISTARPAIA